MGARDSPGGDRVVSLFALGGMVGTVLFFAFTFIIGATRHGYSFLTDEISQLSASGVPASWAQTINFIALGLILMGLAFGLHRGIADGQRSKVGPVLIGTFGLLAAVAAGAFPTDQYGAPETTTGTLHSLTAGIGFIALIVAMFVLPKRLRRTDAWSNLAGLSRWMGGVASILMLLYLFASETEGFLDDYVGLVQRIFAATVLTWLFLVALRLYQTSTAGAFVRN